VKPRPNPIWFLERFQEFLWEAEQSRQTDEHILLLREQHKGAHMAVVTLSKAAWPKKAEAFVVLFLLEAVAFAILPLSGRSEWMPALIYIHAAIIAAFPIGYRIFYGIGRVKEYWPVIYALFAAGMGILVSSLWHMDLTRLFGLPSGSPPEISLAIFFQSLLRVTVVLVLMLVGGVSRDSIYLQKGNLRLGLAVGIPAFLVLAAIAFIPMAGQAGMAERLLELLPWILLFVLSNGFAEEMLYRGLLLKRYEPFLGKRLSNLLAALVFTLLHLPVAYVPDLIPFLAGTFVLALVWGALMQKTDSLWGSALFHAGADCLIIFGVFASL
jgi:membrane protease YdiL (CAAX protease family)